MLIFGWVEGGGSVVGASFRDLLRLRCLGVPSSCSRYLALVLWWSLHKKKNASQHFDALS